MKRPSGVTRPPAPRAPRAPESTTGSPRSRPRDDERLAASPKPRREPRAPVGHPEPDDAREPSEQDQRGQPLEPGAPGDPDATDGASSRRKTQEARRQLRRASGERRRYERAEIRRFTWRSRRRRLFWGIGLGAVGVLVIGAVAVSYSPVMALRQIDVAGTDRVSADAVREAVSGQLGTPLPLVDSEDVGSALAAFPLIQSFSLESRPPGTLLVRIAERTPIGVLATSGGFELVDAAGVLMGTTEKRPEGQPVIDADGGTDSPGFRAAAQVVRSLDPQMRTDLVRVTASGSEDVVMVFADGARVVWGSADESGLKSRVLAALRASVPADIVGEFDVSSPRSPVTR